MVWNIGEGGTVESPRIERAEKKSLPQKKYKATRAKDQKDMTLRNI